MKSLSKSLSTLALTLGLTLASQTQAQGIPVIDIASIVQQIQQVTAWGKQYGQMVEQLNQLQAQFNNMSGIRGMGSLVNIPSSRNYLPNDYGALLKTGVGAWATIRSNARAFDATTATVASVNYSSPGGQLIDGLGNMAALNRASAEEGYRSASNRFADIQTLVDRINNAPDAKDIADLSARIQAEQVMMQNEANKLQALAQLAQYQKDIAAQRAIELNLQPDRPLPKW